MTFEELQQSVLRVIRLYGERFDIAIDEEFAALKLTEEVGEFSKALLAHKGKLRMEGDSPQDVRVMLGSELADILGVVILNASLLGVDLEQELEKKWFRHLEGTAESEQEGATSEQ